MGKILIVWCLVSLMACNDNGTATSEDKDTIITNIPAVDNVNGNIPDTTNTIKVEGSSQSSDPTNDSLQKQ